MLLLNFITGIFLLIIGFCIKKFNMGYLIAGYNTSSKKEKEKYNEKKLTNYVGNLLIISSSFVILSNVLILFFREEKFFLFSWILFTIILIVGVIHMNFSKVVKK